MVRANCGNETASTGLVFDDACTPVGRVSIPDTFCRSDVPVARRLDKIPSCGNREGRPTYVAVWREVKDRIRVVEVIYAGSHEKAPY